MLSSAVIQKSFETKTRSNLKVKKGSGSLATPANNAFAAFAQLSNDCTAASNVFHTLSFGPYHLGDDCDYDCGFMEWEWWWDPDFTSWAPFDNYISYMNIGGAFSNSFQATANYYNNLLASSDSFTQSINAIESIDQAIINQGSPATPEQQQALNNAFSNASSILSNGISGCTNALQNLSQFTSQFSSLNGYLASISSSIQTSIDTCITNNMNDLLAQAKCGSGGIQSAFGGLQTTINNNIAALQPSFNIVNADLMVALQDVEAIAGALLSIQSDDYPTITDPLNTAQGLDPTDVMRLVKLNTALSNWQALIAYAQANLAQ